VNDTLTRLRTSLSKSSPTDNIVETTLAEDQQSFPGVAFGPFGFVEVPTQLTFTQTVVEFDLLLFD
jgi:hypothetical protein